MARRTIGILFLGILALGVVAGAACGDDDDAPEATPSPAPAAADQSDGGDAVSNGSILADTFLTYEGAQYQLRDILQANLIDGEGDFSEVGEATEADIDGDLTVFTKEGDAANVYTFWAGSGEGEAATPDSWYRWEPAD
jgi:hypothetical protein